MYGKLAGKASLFASEGCSSLSHNSDELTDPCSSQHKPEIYVLPCLFVCDQASKMEHRTERLRISDSVKSRKVYRLFGTALSFSMLGLESP